MSTSPNPSKRERREAARAARVEAERAATASATRRRRLTMLLVAAAAAAVLVVVGIVVSSGGNDAGSRPAAAQKAGGPIPGQRESAAMLDGIPQRGIALGDPSAPVRLVEFADMQCPICRAHALEILPVLVQDYVRTGKVRVELQLLSFIGEDSVGAGRAAAAAGQQDRLWNFIDVFFYNQGQENSGYVTADFLQTIYRAAGVNSAKAGAYAESSASDAPLEAANDLADRYGVSGTPTFLVGKREGGLVKLKAAQNDLAGLRSAIDSLLM